MQISKTTLFVRFSRLFNRVSLQGRRGDDCMVAMQSVCIATNVVSSNSAHGEVYSIQHYVIKFASDLRQVDSLFQVLRFPQPIKLTAAI